MTYFKKIRAPLTLFGVLFTAVGIFYTGYLFYKPETLNEVRVSISEEDCLVKKFNYSLNDSLNEFETITPYKFLLDNRSRKHVSPKEFEDSLLVLTNEGKFINIDYSEFPGSHITDHRLTIKPFVLDVDEQRGFVIHVKHDIRQSPKFEVKNKVAGFDFIIKTINNCRICSFFNCTNPKCLG